MRAWPRHFCCAYCTGLSAGERRRATFRLFAGRPEGAGLAGGFPACDLHLGDALAEAFHTMNCPNPPDGWKVSGCRVTASTDGHDDPVMTPLWTARATP